MLIVCFQGQSSGACEVRLGSGDGFGLRQEGLPTLHQLV